MTEKIKLLPEAVANQIAAGEVVNRPASVVKEMTENAVDAGARNITVCFRDGGKSLIQIVDDGCGMTPADARMAFERHATSKIDTVDDIYKLSNFGFRGEALASIAAVAEVELKTRPEDEQVGTQVQIAGGKFVSQSPVSCPPGSQFLIRNLFFNVPARRRFLEKSSTESRHITAEYQRVALCNPDIGFSLYDGDSLISKLPPAPLRQRITGVIGKNIGRNLLEVSANTSIVKLEGFVGRPESARQNNREQFLFVNGRYFKSPYFHKAVVSAYEKLIQPNTQPPYFLYITIDPLRIDVNVHPQKTEVKFTDGSDIWQIINAAARETLAKSGAVPAFDFNLDTSVEIPVAKNKGVYAQPRITANPEFNPFEKYGDDIEPVDSESLLPDFDPSPDDLAIRRRQGPSFAGVSGERESAVSWGAGRVFDPESYTDGGDVQYVESSMGGATDAMDASDSMFEDDSYIEFISGEEASQGTLAVEAEGDRPVMRCGQRYFTTVIDGNLTIVDIPRAFEAVLFELFMTMLGNGSSISQQLLFPEILPMSLDDLALVKQFSDDFTSFGFDIGFTSEQAIEVRAVPADFTGVAVEQLIYDLLDAMRDGTPGDDLRKRKAASALASIGSMSRGSVRTTEEIEHLLGELLACGNHSYTPSGKKVMAVIGEEEIRKKLG